MKRQMKKGGHACKAEGKFHQENVAEQKASAFTNLPKFICQTWSAKRCG